MKSSLVAVPRFFAICLLAWIGLRGAPAMAQDGKPLILLIQPTLSDDATRQSYQPLADYLGKIIGTTVTINMRPNFFTHWETVRRNSGYDLVLDDAHFTDYRIRKFGFRPLVKFPVAMSYSLLVPRHRGIRDPFELAGKNVASFSPPSLGAARLNALFPNTARRPAIVEIGNVQEGIEMLQYDKVAGAMLPTPFVDILLTEGNFVLLVTTEPAPAMALSASPRINARLREKIRAALLSAADSTEGAAMLQRAGIDRFEIATAKAYRNQARVLKEYWGY